LCCPLPSWLGTQDPRHFPMKRPTSFSEQPQLRTEARSCDKFIEEVAVPPAEPHLAMVPDGLWPGAPAISAQLLESTPESKEICSGLDQTPSLSHLNGMNPKEVSHTPRDTLPRMGSAFHPALQSIKQQSSSSALMGLSDPCGVFAAPTSQSNAFPRKEMLCLKLVGSRLSDG
jgi:hypothetical protein